MHLIRAEKIIHDFGKGPLFEPVDLEIRDGKRLLINGENGSGKTTLLRILAGRLKPTGGELTSSMDCAFCDSQGKGLFPELTGMENIQLFSQLSKIKKDIGPWYSFESFDEALKCPFAACSSGMKVLLKIFVTSLDSPAFYFGDEILSPLSEKNRRFFLEHWPQILGSKSLILTDHQAGEWEGETLSLKRLPNA